MRSFLLIFLMVWPALSQAQADNSELIRQANSLMDRKIYFEELVYALAFADLEVPEFEQDTAALRPYITRAYVLSEVSTRRFVDFSNAIMGRAPNLARRHFAEIKESLNDQEEHLLALQGFLIQSSPPEHQELVALAIQKRINDYWFVTALEEVEKVYRKLSEAPQLMDSILVELNTLSACIDVLKQSRSQLSEFLLSGSRTADDFEEAFLALQAYQKYNEISSNELGEVMRKLSAQRSQP